MSDDDIFVKVADDKALNLSQSERMCLDDALTTVDNDDDFPLSRWRFCYKNGLITRHPKGWLLFIYQLVIPNLS